MHAESVEPVQRGGAMRHVPKQLAVFAVVMAAAWAAAQSADNRSGAPASDQANGPPCCCGKCVIDRGGSIAPATQPAAVAPTTRPLQDGRGRGGPRQAAEPAGLGRGGGGAGGGW